MSGYRTTRKMARTRYYAGCCGRFTRRCIIWWGEQIAVARGWLSVQDEDRWRDL